MINFPRRRAPRRYSSDRELRGRLSLLHPGPRTSDRRAACTASSCSARRARSSSIDEATRRQILEHTVKVVNGRVPVFAGVIDPTTDRVIGHAKAAQVARRRCRRRHRSLLHPHRASPRSSTTSAMCKDAVDVPVDRLRHPGLRAHQARAQDDGDARPRRHHRRAQGLERRRRQLPLLPARSRRQARRLPDDRLGDRRRQRPR